MAEKDIIAGIIEQVHECTEGKTCVFRGENNKDHEKISCTLYREQKQIIKENIKEQQKDILEKIDFPAIEQEIIEKAKSSHFPDGTSNIRILTDLQHYGGKTTLIDCTYNMLIALFFACNGEQEEDGRIICLATKDTQPAQDLYGKGHKNDTLLLLSPKSENNRVIFQSSVFVHAPKGFLEEDKCPVKTIPIEKDKKPAYLQALQRYHGIKDATVFNDLQGFIANEDTHKTAQTYFYIAVSYQKKGDHEKAIEYYDTAIRLQPEYAKAHNNRGIAKANLKNYDKAIVDYDTAIRLQSDYVKAYYNRGIAKANLQRCEEAIADYTEAIAIDPNHAYAYNNRGIAHKALGDTKAAKEYYTKALQDYTKALELDPSYKNGLEPAIQRLQQLRAKDTKQ